MKPKEVTTTAAIPIYFPDRRRKKDDEKMNEARLAVMLVEKHGLTHRQALRVVLEDDADGAAKLMAANAAPEDPKKQKEMAKDFKEQMLKAMEADDKPSDEDDDKPKDETDDKDDDDKPAAG